MILESKLSKEALEIFKKSAHHVWEKYDDTYGYRTEKQEANSKVSTDNPDNVWFFINQFDTQNQIELLIKIASEPTSKASIEAFNFLGDFLKELGEEIRKQKEEERMSKN